MSRITAMNDREVMEWAEGIAALVRGTTGWTSEIGYAIRRAVQQAGCPSERDTRACWDAYCDYLHNFDEGGLSLTAPEFLWRWLHDHPDTERPAGETKV